ncbi:unnamed protein product [Lymnaea stagnalis]|uniref:Mitochondrial assembly of ribosomal large subunit protein 1 n=1 Tax=Lymnaea stagnalis TaxID=6523 RepID=A0AAV2H9Y1_LYMST
MNKVPINTIRSFCKCQIIGVKFCRAFTPVKNLPRCFSSSTAVAINSNTFTPSKRHKLHLCVLDRTKVINDFACSYKCCGSQLKYSTDKGRGSKNEETDSSREDIVIEQDLIKNDPDLKSLLDDLRKDFDGGPSTKESKRTAPEILKHKDGKGNSAESSKIEHPLKQSTVKSEEFSLKSTQNYSLDSLGSNFSEPNSIKTTQDQGTDFLYDYRVAQDIEEYDYKDEKDIAQQQIRSEKVHPISMKRGNSGVFDIDELLVLLEDLGAENVVTLPIPPEARFCDHMVIASAKSKRHLSAINDEMLWVHKRKKAPNDPNLNIEGLGKSDWSAMDMGNIVLHVFYGDTREYYDIESLWTLGPQNDPKCQEMNQDPYNLSPEDLFWLETGKSNHIASKTVPPSDSGRLAKAGITKKSQNTSDGVKDGAFGWDTPKTPCFS